MNYTDPSGHCSVSGDNWCYEEDSPSFDELFEEFSNDATRIAKNQGRKNALEAYAKIVDKAASIFGGDWKQMMKALGMVFLGLPSEGGVYNGPGTLMYADGIAEGKYNTGENFPAYFIGNMFSDSGFNEIFRDGTNNQPYHSWANIAQTTQLEGYEAPVFTEAVAANYKHEFAPGGPGGSAQDFTLSVASMQIGGEISSGKVSPYDLGNVLRTNLGEGLTSNPANFSPGYNLLLYMER